MFPLGLFLYNKCNRVMNNMTNIIDKIKEARKTEIENDKITIQNVITNNLNIFIIKLCPYYAGASKNIAETLKISAFLANNIFNEI